MRTKLSHGICLNGGRNGITTWNNSFQGQRNEICWNSIHLPAFTPYLSCLKIRHIQSLTCPVTWSSFPVAGQTCVFLNLCLQTAELHPPLWPVFPAVCWGGGCVNGIISQVPTGCLSLAVSLGGQTLSCLPFPSTITHFITCYTWLVSWEVPTCGCRQKVYCSLLLASFFPSCLAYVHIGLEINSSKKVAFTLYFLVFPLRSFGFKLQMLFIVLLFKIGDFFFFFYFWWSVCLNDLFFS